MSALHVFDMDGTLLRGSACLEISRAIGVLDETLAIEDGWIRGTISDNGFWEQCLPLWEGLSDEHIDSAFAATPWLDGVEAVFGDIRARGEHSVVISQSPKFFVERLQRWGAGYTFGSLVQPGNGKGADMTVSTTDKVRITDELLGELGLTVDDCVAYGDSSSDRALFEHLTRTVAVNAKESIRRLARASYEGSDFWAAYLAGRRLLDARETKSPPT
jgi:phosphoserine phosphatase